MKAIFLVLAAPLFLTALSPSAAAEPKAGPTKSAETETYVETNWPTFATERVRLQQRIDDILIVKQKKIVTASPSFSTSFLRPTWALKLGGPTISAGGAVMSTKDRPTSPP
jgi:hypothetical protein